MYHDNITEELFRRAALKAQTYKFPIPPSDAETSVYTYIKDVLQQYLDSSDSWDSGTFLSVTTELLSYSLISYDQVNAAYTLHVLVHDWISTVVPHSKEVAVEHTMFLLAVSISTGDTAADYAYKRGLEVHVNSVLQRQGKPRANNALAFAAVYNCVGKWALVEAMELVGLEARRRAFGDEHPSTLTSMHNLALTYHDLGRYAEAEALQVQELEASKRVSGDEHPDTLTSMHNLALTYKDTCRHEEAEAMQVQVVERSKRTLDPKHPHSLAAMQLLAEIYRSLGTWRQNELHALEAEINNLEI
ncbi:hypothetical protein FS749_002147 [Ceratobasidium sp. UAMH 11750]|nr:hypothetical protein FS749_002147 [Ceratobasidium sp. UAMH 11750]